MAHRETAGYLGAGLMVHGRLSGKASLAVDGRIEGDVALEGSLTVGRGAHVVASLVLDALSVEGSVRGEVVARREVLVRRDGRVDGTVRAPKVTLDEGARLHGQILTVPVDPAAEPREPQA